MAERSYYTLAEVAQLLGIHYETAARWVRTGKLSAVKLSRRKVIVPKQNLDALLAGAAAANGTRDHLPVGSPQRWLALAGTLTPEEADQLLAFSEAFESVEEPF